MDFSGVLERLKNPIENLPDHQYEYWINKTSKLIKRSYIQTHKLVEAEKLSLEQIIDRFELSTKHNGNCPPDKCWWGKRKKEYKNEKKKIVSIK